MQLIHRVEPIGPSGMAGNEYQVALAGASLAPFQIVLRMNRLVVFVNPEEANVEVVAGIFKIVRIAAVEGDLLLRSEHQTHVGVALETIELIQAALVKRDDIA